MSYDDFWRKVEEAAVDQRTSQFTNKYYELLNLLCYKKGVKVRDLLRFFDFSSQDIACLFYENFLLFETMDVDGDSFDLGNSHHPIMDLNRTAALASIHLCRSACRRRLI